MGSGEPPVLPNYHFLARDDGERQFSGYVRECNYMQQLENALDPVHATILHGRAVHGLPAAPEWMETPDFNVVATETMAYYVARRKGPEPGTEWHREVAYVPPIMVVHHGGSLARRSTERRWSMSPGACRSTISRRGLLLLKFFPAWFGEAGQRRKTGQAETAAAHARHAQAVRHGDDQRPGQRGAGEPRSDRRSSPRASWLFRPRRDSSAQALAETRSRSRSAAKSYRT